MVTPMKRPTLFGFVITATIMASTLFVMDKCHAGEARLDWQNPTQNVDGTFIPPSGEGRLIGNRVEWSRCTTNGNFGTVVGQQVFTEPTQWYTVQNLGTGTWCFRAYASTTYGESAASAIASKEILPTLPQAPTGLTVQAMTVYTVVKRVDRFVLTPVGTAPVGTQCVANQNINGMYVVPRAAVQWSGSQRPDVVVASCQ